MDQRKLDKLKREIRELRRKTVKAKDLQSVASRLGRKVVNRGKHPMWESEEFDFFPISIPDHGGGKDIPDGTKKSILNQLEDDLMAWEERLSDEDDDKNEEE